MAKKSKKHTQDKKPVVYQYFNVYNKPLANEDVLSLLWDTASQVCSSYTPHFYPGYTDRLDIFDKLLRKCDNAKYENFKRYWMDVMVYEMSCKVWNNVFQNLRFAKGEHFAEKQANDAQFLFKQKFI